MDYSYPTPTVNQWKVDGETDKISVIHEKFTSLFRLEASGSPDHHSTFSLRITLFHFSRGRKVGVHLISKP